MSNVLYIEPFSGASGDMFLSALCALTDEYDLIQSLPSLLNLKDGKVEVNQVEKNGIVCKHLKILDLNPETHTHHHTHPPTHTHHSDHHHHHISDYVKMGWHKLTHLFGGHHHHTHTHTHTHTSHTDHHHEEQRGLKEINDIIDFGDISTNAKKIAKDIFQIVGQSESRIHDISIDKIHFHELSGVDSILDIVGCAVLIDNLDISKTYCEPICTGFGKVNTQHGILPVPAPATHDIIKDLPNYKGNEKGEKLTPTGAAIIKFLNPSFEIPALKMIDTAYGPGEKDFKNPNVLRLSLVEEVDQKQPIEPLNKNVMYSIECNIDDTSPEMLGVDFQNKLLSQGATDFHLESTQMKKGRPGLKLSVLVSSRDLDTVSDFILENTTTIGVRYYPVKRKILERRNIDVKTQYGQVRVKEVTTPSGKKRHKIEFESIAEIARKHELNYTDLQEELYREVLNQLHQ